MEFGGGVSLYEGIVLSCAMILHNNLATPEAIYVVTVGCSVLSKGFPACIEGLSQSSQRPLPVRIEPVVNYLDVGSGREVIDTTELGR